jgi:hypothetical protein
MELDNGINQFPGLLLSRINHPDRTGGVGTRPVQNTFSGLKPTTPGSLIAGFKSSVTKQINHLHKTPGKPVWQHNYWEHINRDDESYDKIVDYINTNPMN